MINKIIEILNATNEIDAWKLTERKTKSSELFFIKNKLEMNRGKDVVKYKISVYNDFSNNEHKYRGSADVELLPDMEREEIEQIIQEAAVGASFIKNKYYPLADPVEIDYNVPASDFYDNSFADILSQISEALFESDNFDNGGLNSAELFLNEHQIRIINSKGVDNSYQKRVLDIDFITNWQENSEEIELSKIITLAEFDLDTIINTVREMLIQSRERSKAESLPNINDIPVILTGSSVKELLEYFYVQANAKQIYENVSIAEIGESMQGKEIKGDKVDLLLDPNLSGSTHSVPFDKDGFPLSAQKIIEGGKLLQFWGDIRFSHYLGIEATGDIKNLSFAEGSYSEKELKSEPHLELLVFSNFQMDHLAGNFGGEIRLGRYFDGEKSIPVTGGSISANINKIKNDMLLSIEKQQINNYYGPKFIKLNNISIAGG